MTFHEALPAAVATAAPSVLRVDAGRRRASSAVALTDTFVVAASHAVRRDDVRVVDHSGVAHEVELLGRDRALDIALLRAKGGLVAATLAPTADLAVGTPVLALGRPGRSIRASFRIVGLVSDDVDVGWGEKLERFVESDRGFPRGFAGGPLVDLEGRTLGMNTDAAMRGVDLTLPIETLQRVAAELETHGRVRRGYLGVGVRSITLPDEVRDDVGRAYGAMVTAVEKGSPADRGGIVLGDVLFELDGRPVGGPHQLVGVLRDRAGATFDVRVLRAGAPTSVTVTAAERP